MRVPRDVSGDELAKRIGELGYQITRQTGSHIRLTRVNREEHHITIPRHRTLKIGTLSNIRRDIAENLKISKAEIIDKMWKSD
jgi:predicted RNA binding protein YcfA (HicA-like mRNA interferase family)